MKIAPIQLQSPAEHSRLNDLFSQAFTPWYSSLPPRRVINFVARALPEFFVQLESEGNEVTGYLFCIPIYWNGEADTLESYDFYTANRFQGRPARKLQFLGLLILGLVLPRVCVPLLRNLLLKGSNTVMILAMVITREARGVGVSQKFFDYLKENFRQRGFQSIVGPFRPSAFGTYKAAHGLVLSSEIFEDYCAKRGADGLSIDPWLRSAQKNGVQFLRAETRSVRVSRSIRAFASFRASFKRDSWRERPENVWECGEVPTWYVDKNLDRAFSVEPNLWGRIPLPS